jgi:hypothetical protein
MSSNATKKLIIMSIGAYLLFALVGAGFLTNSIWNSTDDGDKRCLNLDDQKLRITKAFLLLYMIITSSILFAGAIYGPY